MYIHGCPFGATVNYSEQDDRIANNYPEGKFLHHFSLVFATFFVNFLYLLVVVATI